MSPRTKILAVLSLPAGLVGYLVAGAVLSGLPLTTGIGDVLQLFVPLLVGGLCMGPFLIPFFDQMAKRDLAALQEQRRTGAPPDPEAPADESGGR
jgi:hypothetical protein